METLAELGPTRCRGLTGAHSSFFLVRHDARTPRQRWTEHRIRWSSSQPPTVTSSTKVATTSTPSQRIKAAAGAGGTPL